MIEGAHSPGSSPAFHTPCRPVDPCEPAENAETLKTVKTLKRVRAARSLKQGPAAPGGETLTLPCWRVATSMDVALSRKREREFGARLRLPLPLAGSNREAVRRRGEGRAVAPVPETVKHRAAPTAETLKHETAPASRGRAEMVKHALGRPCRIALRTRCETLKHPQRMQQIEAVICFTAIAGKGGLRWRPTTGAASRRCGETLKHLDALHGLAALAERGWVGAIPRPEQAGRT